MKYLLIAGVAVIAIFLIVLNFIPIGIEPLTELYFENHTALPTNVSLKNSYPFSFTTHNLEYQDVEYNYTIIAYDANNSFLFEIDKGTFILTNNKSSTIDRNFTFNNKFERAKIEVVLTKNLIGNPEFKKKLWWPDPNYPYTVDIHFWVDEVRR